MTNTTFSNGYALLIGIGADLPVTVKDATALRDVLVNPSRAGYPPDQVELLTETRADRQSILDAFDKLIEQVSTNPDATVLVYFSGHGIQVERKEKPNEYFLIPYGYNPDQAIDTAISGAEITEKIEAIKARKLIVLLDCCHAGGIPTYKAPGVGVIKSIPLPPNLLDILEKGSGRVIIASSRENEKSYVVNGMPYSVFTTCLMEALMGKAARNKDGYAHILDIMIYLIEQVPQRISDRQHPFVSRVLNLDENFPFCYYAGGSKDVPGEMPAFTLESPTKLTSIRRHWLEERRAILLNEWNIRVEKLRRLRKAWTLEMNPGIKLQREMEIQDEEEALIRLETEIEEIERELQ